MRAQPLGKPVAAVLIVLGVAAGMMYWANSANAAEIDAAPNCYVPQPIDIGPQPELGEPDSLYCVYIVTATKTVLKTFYKWVYDPIPHRVVSHYEEHDMEKRCTVGSKWCAHDTCLWVTVAITTSYP